MGILKIHIHATLGKSHLGSNIAIFIQKNIGIQRIHMNVDRFPASLESEAGERTLSKVGIQVQWPILKKIPIAADKMGTELEPAVQKFSENGCEKRFLFTTFVTIIT